MQEQMNSMNDSGEFQEVESNYSGRLSYVSSQPAVMARGMESPRQVTNGRWRGRDGPEPACVQTSLFRRWHMQGGEGRINGGTVQSAWQGGRTGLPARVSGRHVVRMTVLTCPGMRPGEQARLVKTVKIQVRWAAAHPGQDRRLPGVVTLEDGSGVAVDWVTGRPYSSARRRLNVQSGLRKGR